MRPAFRNTLLIAAATTTFAVAGISGAYTYKIRKLQEKIAEQQVRTAYASREATGREMGTLFHETWWLPEQSKLLAKEHLRETYKHLHKTNSFFSSYAPQGDPTRYVTFWNGSDVCNAVPQKELDAAKTELDKARAIFRRVNVLDLSYRDGTVSFRYSGSSQSIPFTTIPLE
jgi:hypothetical protein